MVSGAIVPTLFFGAPCWALVVHHQKILAELDSVLAMSAKFAFGLECNTSTEVSLAIAGILPARLHIIRQTLRYFVRRRREELFRDPTPIHRFYVTPMELGRWWFHRFVRGRTLRDPPPQLTRPILNGIVCALRAEWQCRWDVSDTGSALRAIHAHIGCGWRPVDIDRCSQLELTLVARFIMGHCHLHDFAFPWDFDELADCPWCGDAFSRSHMLWDYIGLTSERAAVLQVGSHVGDLEWVARHRASSLGKFLIRARSVLARG